MAISGSLGTGNGFVTCGHSTNTYDKFKNGAGVEYGTTIYVRYNNNKYGDFSLVQATSDWNKINRVWTGTGSYATISGHTDIPAVGSVLSKYGYASGASVVTVNATNVSVTYGSVVIKGLCRGTSNIDSIPGDSGGPYRSGSYICGVHSGASTSDRTKVYFTPYYYIRTCGYNFAY